MIFKWKKNYGIFFDGIDKSNFNGIKPSTHD
jgi:hypothetical protein